MYLKLKDHVAIKKDESTWSELLEPIVACLCLHRFALRDLGTVGKTKNNARGDCNYEFHVVRLGNCARIIVISVPGTPTSY